MAWCRALRAGLIGGHQRPCAGALAAHRDYPVGGDVWPWATDSVERSRPGLGNARSARVPSVRASLRLDCRASPPGRQQRPRSGVTVTALALTSQQEERHNNRQDRPRDADDRWRRVEKHLEHQPDSPDRHEGDQAPDLVPTHERSRSDRYRRRSRRSAHQASANGSVAAYASLSRGHASERV